MKTQNMIKIASKLGNVIMITEANRNKPKLIQILEK